MGDFYSESYIRARKTQYCEVCRRTIRPGVRYVKIAQVYQGDFHHNLTCRMCKALIATMFRLFDLDEMDYQAAREEARDYAMNRPDKRIRWLRLRTEWRKQLREIAL